MEAMTRSTTLPAGLVRRARVVLLAADGVGNQVIADRGRDLAADGESVAGPVRAAGYSGVVG